MFDLKRNCEIKVIPKNEKFTILGTFGIYQPYLYFTNDGSLVISTRQISKDDTLIIYRNKKYNIIVKSEEKYDSIGKLIEYCFDIGVKEIALISKSLFDDYITLKSKNDIMNNLYGINLYVIK